MSIINTLSLKSNRQIKINFDEGDLSSDAGLLLIKIQLRDGTQYSCTGVIDFLQPILDEYLNDYPGIKLLLRGDSGFATPELYKQCEENGLHVHFYCNQHGFITGIPYQVLL